VVSQHWILVGVLFLFAGTFSQAQVIVVNPPPVVAPMVAPIVVNPVVPVLVPNGISFRYRSGNFAVGGFFGTGMSVGVLHPAAPLLTVPLQPVVVAPPSSVLPTYGVVNTRVTVQVIVPTVVLREPSPGPDVSGIDLDVTPPPWAPPRAAVPRIGDGAARAPERKAAPVAPIIKPPPAAAAPKVDPVRDARTLLQAGVRAFRDNEIGLAGQRFRQALDLDPKLHEGYFYLAESLAAVGKYDEAFNRIGQGLKLRPDWPRDKFRPRVELYGLHIEEWQQHVRTLENAQKADPKNGKLLFLVGYMHWFNGNQPEAFDFFRRARPLLADPSPAQRFLDAAPMLVRR
jgi:hypothetical protein